MRMSILLLAIVLVAPAVAQDTSTAQITNLEAEIHKNGPGRYEASGRANIVLPLPNPAAENPSVADCTQNGCNDGWNLNAPDKNGSGFWFQGATASEETVFFAGPKEALIALDPATRNSSEATSEGDGQNRSWLLPGLLISALVVILFLAWLFRRRGEEDTPAEPPEPRPTRSPLTPPPAPDTGVSGPAPSRGTAEPSAPAPGAIGFST